MLQPSAMSPAATAAKRSKQHKQQLTLTQAHYILGLTML
jgi:hypothetical protein